MMSRLAVLVIKLLVILVEGMKESGHTNECQ